MRTNHVHVEPGHTRIKMIGEAIGKIVLHSLHGLTVGKDVDVAQHAVRPQIVESAHMIVVLMGEQQAVYLPERLRQELHTNVGATVEEDPRGVALDECRTAEPLVVGILAAAYLAAATYNGHTVRCARS